MVGFATACVSTVMKSATSDFPQRTGPRPQGRGPCFALRLLLRVPCFVFKIIAYYYLNSSIAYSGQFSIHASCL